jgi:hypothetical protein
MKCPNATAVRTIALWQILAQALVTVILVCVICEGQDEATLYLINKSSSGWVGCIPSKLTIVEGDKKILELDHQHYAVVPIEPGHHVMQLKHIHLYLGSPPKVELDVLPGQAYHFVAANNRAVAACYTSFKKVSKGEAEKLSAKMKPQPANSALP